VFGGLIGVPFGAAVALRSIRSLLASARARATIRIAFQPVSLSKNATPVAFAARPIEARDHAELDRIGGGNEDDRNRLRCQQSRLQLIEEGSRADVFLSADTHWMDYGIQKKVIKDDSCFLLLGNTHRRIPNLEMSRSSRVSTWVNWGVMASSRLAMCRRYQSGYMRRKHWKSLGHGTLLPRNLQ